MKIGNWIGFCLGWSITGFVFELLFTRPPFLLAIDVVVFLIGCGLMANNYWSSK